MLRIFSLLVFLFAQSVTAGEPLALFNGNDLDGWQVQGDVEWVVQEQALVASGKGDGFLVSDQVFGDFYLKVEFWVDAALNSGIFIRCQDRARIHPETCYELNIWDEHPKQDARTGAIVFKHMPPLAHVETAGRWSTYEVLAVGGNIEVKVNGTTTAVLKDADPAPGFIALQHWGEGSVKFWKVLISPR